MQRGWPDAQARLDFVQREAEKLEREYLLEPQQIRLGIEPVACLRVTGGREQANFVVVPQRALGDGGFLRELACLVKLGLQVFPP